MTGRLKGRRALIAGAAGGIGRAVARLFRAEGADLAIFDLDSTGVTDAVTEVGGIPSDRRVFGFHGDVSVEDQCVLAVQGAVDALGGLEVLVNCVAVRAYHPLGRAPVESWERILGVNLLGAQNLAKAALPVLRRTDRASIVNVSSVFGLVGRRGMGQYDATKAALVSLTRTLAVEEAENGVRVNVVCPGSVWTPFTASRAAARGMTEEELRRTGAAPALIDRWAEPEEIAYPILWLACDEASFVTGTCLVVDGGLSAT